MDLRESFFTVCIFDSSRRTAAMAPTGRVCVAASRVSIHPTFRPGFICLQCQRRASTSANRRAAPSRNRLSSPSRRHASSSLTDKLRRRIWGTDTPPGQADPYAKATSQERTAVREQEELEKRAVEDQELLEEAEEEEEEAYDEVDNTREYVPASTWHRLRSLPTWKEDGTDAKREFKGFIAPSKVESPDAIRMAVQRAVVEVWTLKQAGQPLDLGTAPTSISMDLHIRLATGTTFTPRAGDELVLVYADEQLQQDVLASLQPRTIEEEVAEEEARGELQSEIDEPLRTMAEPPSVNDSLEPATFDNAGPIPPEEKIGAASDIVSSPMDKTWRNISLQDPDLKFAVLKRVMQLTGHRLPDPSIQHITTTKNLLGQLIKKPPPKKLVEKLLRTPALAQLPNVEIYAKRYTAVDREEEVGRWKVIRGELMARGLPVDMRKVVVKGALK